VAAESKADLIVMATHGRTGLGRLLMGSVAEQVVRQAPCPVVTVRLPFPAERPARPASGARPEGAGEQDSEAGPALARAETRSRP
jgi:hypothetical protein